MTTSTSTVTVKFNIGGHKYEVSRSLLSHHPNTLLARSVSEQCQCQCQCHDDPDPESEIFIERDGERFRYCLDYLRDGYAILPFIVSKEAVINDLKYYGVQNVDEDAIGHYPSKEAQISWALSCVNDVTINVKDEISAIKAKAEEECSMIMAKAEKEMICREAAILCFKTYIETNSLELKFCNNPKIYKACENEEIFNDCLSRFGLKYEGHLHISSVHINTKLYISTL